MRKMKKLMIFVLVLIGLTMAGEVILPRLITQTFSLIDSLPGITVTSPHWLFEKGIVRYTGLVTVLGVITIYTFMALLRRRKGVI